MWILMKLKVILRFFKCMESMARDMRHPYIPSTTELGDHKTQLGHLRIPQATRRVIASKLKSGITAQRIIDDIRDSETNHI